MACATSSMPIWRDASSRGSTSIRTANFWAPWMLTCATPVTVESRCARMVSAYSFTCDRGSVSEATHRNSTGESAGLTFCRDGGVGMPGGNWRSARAIIDCTSCAAASMFRSRLNWSVTLVLPWLLVEMMESTPAIAENCFSSGVATAVAIVSGLAPGSPASTWMVGKSTVGRSLTGSCR